MNDILFRILICVAYVAAAALFRYALPYLRQKLKNTKYEFIVMAIEDAVYGYEQMIQGAGLGPKRKELVKDFAAKICRESGIEITDEQIELIIESAVQGMNATKAA